MQALVLVAGCIEWKGDALGVADGVGFNVGEAHVGLVHDFEDGLKHLVLVFAACLVGNAVGAKAGAALKEADHFHGNDDDEGGDGGCEVEPGSASHADGGDGPYAGGAGETADAGAIAKDEARAEEADALNDIGGDLAFVGTVFAGEDCGEKREEGRSHGDEEVGADAGGAAMEFALEADRGAEGTGEEQAADGAVEHVDLLQIAEAEGERELCDGEGHWGLERCYHWGWGRLQGWGQ